MTALAQDVRTACEDEPELFHAPDQESPADKKWRETEAKTICAACPTAIRESCLQLAMDAERGLSAGNRWGLYGGLTEKERADLDKADKPQDGRPECPSCGRTFKGAASLGLHRSHAHLDETVASVRELVGEGLSDAQIGSRLGIDPKNVWALRKRNNIPTAFPQNKKAS